MKSRLLAAHVIAVWVLTRAVAAQDPLPEIHGRVVAADGGGAIAGAHVFGPGGLTRSDASGGFSLPVKPDSEDQTLLARAEGYSLYHAPLLPTSHEAEIVVRLEAARIAVVRVVGEDGSPIRGVTVHGRLPFVAAYSTLERLDFNGVTGQDGVAVLKDLPSDLPLVAEVRVPRMISAQSGTLFPMRIPAPSELAAAAETITVTPGRMLKLVVENGSGQPVAGASISLLPLIEPRLDFSGHVSRDTTKGSIRTGLTDAAGSVTFDLLPANPITCEIRATGMTTQVLVVEGAKGRVSPVRVKLAPDPNPPASDIPWRGSVAAATEEANRSGLPVFLVITMDGEKANDWMAGHHYHDPEIVRAAREVVPILASAFGEGGVGADPEHKEVDGRCARYGTISCRVHQEIEKAVREAVMMGRTLFEVPRHVAATPAGEPFIHRVFYLSERDLLRLIVRALRTVSRTGAVRLARERLATVLDDVAQVDGPARKRGARALALLANSGDEHAAAILQALSSLEWPPATRAEIVAELCPSALTSREVTLAGLVRDPDREVRRALFARLAEVSGDETMLDLLASELRTSDVQSREALLKTLEVERKGDELWVRAPAAGNRWRVLEELIEMPDAGRIQGVGEALLALDTPGRNRVLRALERRAPADPAAQDVLVRAVKGETAVAAVRAIGQAAAAMKLPNPLARALVEAARSPDLLVREEALRSLAALPVPVDSEVLAANLDHPSAPIRIQAALALWRRGNKSGEPTLFKAANDAEFGAEVRAALRN